MSLHLIDAVISDETRTVSQLGTATARRVATRRETLGWRSVGKEILADGRDRMLARRDRRVTVVLT